MIKCMLPCLSSQASRILGIPQVLTEQYPKGLGPTVPELGAEDLKAHTKTSFTMMTEEVEKELQALGNPKQAILCGIEAHACIAVRQQHLINTVHLCVIWYYVYILLHSAQHLTCLKGGWRLILWPTPSRPEGVISCPTPTGAALRIHRCLCALVRVVMSRLPPQSDRPVVRAVTAEAERGLPHHHRGRPPAAGSGRKTPQLQGGAASSITELCPYCFTLWDT